MNFYLVPMKNPLPTARHIPTTLNEGLLGPTNPLAEALALALAEVVDILRKPRLARFMYDVGYKAGRKVKGMGERADRVEDFLNTVTP